MKLGSCLRPQNLETITDILSRNGDWPPKDQWNEKETSHRGQRGYMSWTMAISPWSCAIKTLKSPHLVQKQMDCWTAARWMEESLYDTVAVGHGRENLVNEFHGILQLCADTWRMALRRVILNHLVRWTEHQSIIVFDLLRFHQFGNTVLLGTLLECVWYGEREFWNELLVVADLEQLDDTDASEFRDEKPNSKEMISPKLVKVPKTANGKLRFIGGNQDLRTPPWQGIIQDQGEVQNGLLGDSDGFPPTTKHEFVAHHLSIQWSATTSPTAKNYFEKHLAKLDMNYLPQQADLRRRAQSKTCRQIFQSGNTNVESANKGWKIHVQHTENCRERQIPYT